VVGKSKSIVTNGGANVQIGLRSKTVRNSNLLNLCSQKEQEQAQAFRITTCKRNSGSRPTLDDVERTSKGQGAKARGTGSRRIPQRLSAEERRQYNIAKQKV